MMNIVELFLVFVVAVMGLGLIISINNLRRVKRLN